MSVAHGDSCTMQGVESGNVGHASGHVKWHRWTKAGLVSALSIRKFRIRTAVLMHSDAELDMHVL